ncbi:MAG TPA: hypothetical protein VF145_00990 [Chitinophagaceae bacterium]
MKSKIIYSLLVLFILTSGPAQSQALNWHTLKKQNKHILSAQAGFDHGFSYGASYAYRLNDRLFPAYISVDFSSPAGDQVLDDFKSRIGGSIHWLRYRNFRFSTNLYGVFRRYQNSFTTLSNFGSDFSGVIGYYRRHWFAAAETGFDKAIVTHFKHAAAYKQQYPDVVDGWYEPATGGNFYYGLQAGVSFGKHDLWLKAGKTLVEDFKTRPTVPFYGQLGYNLKF